MSSSEYDELLNDLYAKVEAGEITEEEACKKMWSVDKIWMAPDCFGQSGFELIYVASFSSDYERIGFLHSDSRSSRRQFLP